MCCQSSPLSSAGLVAVAIAEGRLRCPDLYSLQKDNEPHGSPNEWRGRPRFRLFPHNELQSFQQKATRLFFSFFLVLFLALLVSSQSELSLIRDNYGQKAEFRYAKQPLA